MKKQQSKAVKVLIVAALINIVLLGLTILCLLKYKTTTSKITTKQIDPRVTKIVREKVKIEKREIIIPEVDISDLILPEGSPDEFKIITTPPPGTGVKPDIITDPKSDKEDSEKEEDPEKKERPEKKEDPSEISDPSKAPEPMPEEDPPAPKPPVLDPKKATDPDQTKDKDAAEDTDFLKPVPTEDPELEPKPKAEPKIEKTDKENNIELLRKTRNEFVDKFAEIYTWIFDSKEAEIPLPPKPDENQHGIVQTKTEGEDKDCYKQLPVLEKLKDPFKTAQSPVEESLIQSLVEPDPFLDGPDIDSKTPDQDSSTSALTKSGSKFKFKTLFTKKDKKKGAKSSITASDGEIAEQTRGGVIRRSFRRLSKRIGKAFKNQKDRVISLQTYSDRQKTFAKNLTVIRTFKKALENQTDLHKIIEDSKKFEQLEVKMDPFKPAQQLLFLKEYYNVFMETYGNKDKIASFKSAISGLDNTIKSLEEKIKQESDKVGKDKDFGNVEKATQKKFGCQIFKELCQKTLEFLEELGNTEIILKHIEGLKDITEILANKRVFIDKMVVFMDIFESYGMPVSIIQPFSNKVKEIETVINKRIPTLTENMVKIIIRDLRLKKILVDTSTVGEWGLSFGEFWNQLEKQQDQLVMSTVSEKADATEITNPCVDFLNTLICISDEIALLIDKIVRKREDILFRIETLAVDIINDSLLNAADDEKTQRNSNALYKDVYELENIWSGTIVKFIRANYLFSTLEKLPVDENCLENYPVDLRCFEISDGWFSSPLSVVLSELEKVSMTPTTNTRDKKVSAAKTSMDLLIAYQKNQSKCYDLIYLKKDLFSPEANFLVIDDTNIYYKLPMILTTSETLLENLKIELLKIQQPGEAL